MHGIDCSRNSSLRSLRIFCLLHEERKELLEKRKRNREREIELSFLVQFIDGEEHGEEKNDHYRWYEIDGGFVRENEKSEIDFQRGGKCEVKHEENSHLRFTSEDIFIP